MSKLAEAGKKGMLSRFSFCSENMSLLKKVMLYTFLFGFLAHGFMLTNLSASHDAVFNFYDELPAHQHQIELGRFLEPLYRELTGSCLFMPWSLGVVAFFWLGIAVFGVWCRHLYGKLHQVSRLVFGMGRLSCLLPFIRATYR